MNNDQVLQVFRDAGALLEGHFILSSGRRSPVFLQKALVFSQPELSSKLCAALDSWSLSLTSKSRIYAIWNRSKRRCARWQWLNALNA